MPDRQRTSPALARTRELAERSQSDLKLLHDATLAAQIPFIHLAKVKRARAEITNLLREINPQPEGKM
jgi:homoserine dehydrogenase